MTDDVAGGTSELGESDLLVDEQVAVDEPMANTVDEPIVDEPVVDERIVINDIIVVDEPIVADDSIVADEPVVVDKPVVVDDEPIIVDDHYVAVEEQEQTEAIGLGDGTSALGTIAFSSNII